MKTVNVHYPDADRVAMKDIAVKRGTNQADQYREAVTVHIATHAKKRKPARP